MFSSSLRWTTTKSTRSMRGVTLLGSRDNSVLNVISGNTLGKWAAWGGGLCGTVTLHWYLIQRKSKWYGSCAFWSFFGLCTTVDLTTKCTIMYLSSCILVLFGAISDYKEPLSWRKNTKSTKSTKSTRFGHPTTVCDTMLSTTIKHDKHQKHERRTSD